MRDRSVIIALWLLVIAVSILVFPVLAELDDQPSNGSVVKVVGNSGHGSGFYIGNGLVITANHVVDAEGKYHIKLASGRVFDVVETMWVAKERDVALLRVDANDSHLQSVGIACGGYKSSDSVRHVGYPFELGEWVSRGYISNPYTKVGKSHWQTEIMTVDISSAPGLSGGPLYDTRNKVVGMVVGGVGRKGGGMVYAVPGVVLCQLLGRG